MKIHGSPEEKHLNNNFMSYVGLIVHATDAVNLRNFPENIKTFSWKFQGDFLGSKSGKCLWMRGNSKRKRNLRGCLQVLLQRVRLKMLKFLIFLKSACENCASEVHKRKSKPEIFNWIQKFMVKTKKFEFEPEIFS